MTPLTKLVILYSRDVVQAELKIYGKGDTHKRNTTVVVDTGSVLKSPLGQEFMVSEASLQ